MKKNKHITVNITEAEHEKIEKIAEQEARTITDTARLLLLKALKTAEGVKNEN